MSNISIFGVLNLSTGSYITIDEYAMSVRKALRVFSCDPNRHIGLTETKNWYISPPSQSNLVDIASYFGIPVAALDIITISSGYSYDSE